MKGGQLQAFTSVLTLSEVCNVCIMSDGPHPIPKGFNYPCGVDDMWYIMAATNSCAQV
jgi:hypothetical protein